MALLVYDMQVAIAGRLPGTQPVIDQCAEVLDAVRTAGVRVFLARHLTLPSEVAGAVLELGIDPTVRHGADLGYTVTVAFQRAVPHRPAGPRGLRRYRKA